MGQRKVERLDAAEILRVQHMLGADPARGAGAQIGLERTQHRIENRNVGDAQPAAARFQRLGKRFVNQRVKDDAGGLLDFAQRPFYLCCRADQRVNMLDRMSVLVLDCGRPADVDQRFTCRIGYQVEVKVALCGHALILWTNADRSARSHLPGLLIPLTPKGSTGLALWTGRDVLPGQGRANRIVHRAGPPSTLLRGGSSI
jgi:hypothetical protein